MVSFPMKIVITVAPKTAGVGAKLRSIALSVKPASTTPTTQRYGQWCQGRRGTMTTPRTTAAAPVTIGASGCCRLGVNAAIRSTVTPVPNARTPAIRRTARHDNTPKRGSGAENDEEDISLRESAWSTLR